MAAAFFFFFLIKTLLYFLEGEISVDTFICLAKSSSNRKLRNLYNKNNDTLKNNFEDFSYLQENPYNSKDLKVISYQNFMSGYFIAPFTRLALFVLRSNNR
jgi:hypothetical protein